MITILYPYRNREESRVKRSLDSLAQQSNQDFKVVFVDYGSVFDKAATIKILTQNYDFVTYLYSYHSYQPWSRAKAINIGLQNVTTPFVFVADVDMIFSHDFIEKLITIQNPNQAVFFKVGFLDHKESIQVKPFDQYKVSFFSQGGAKGLSLFPLNALHEIHGFDEFLHFWGAEDEDVHNRLENAGYQSLFYDQEILMLHQWHVTYRKAESKGLNRDLQLTNISRINQAHLLDNKKQKRAIVNLKQWGQSISKREFDELENSRTPFFIANRKESISHFLFVILPNFKGGVLNVIFQKDDFQNSLKYYVKKRFGKTVPEYYSLKEINDKVLLHLISFYKDCNYFYIIGNDLKSIQLKIKKE
ncbi:glycosyltransferase family 2 protein [Flavobacterium sp. M31R6]|uniref:glycosyltransferase family 2 protein n=1 Tax=Flavobacterium sp. M31R6 TaxID=2739062 RepID=UPI00156964B2|nr:glycosyltransferase family A protein [Flavobacterium sp. M31R6]QKJ64799.1 glycosyltransferase family 2 protein [Flavobacterium sp. M31R6]